MFLIAAASYCSNELQSEFGKLPPAFLPLGNKRLFQHQIFRVPENEAIYLSLPEGFEINQYDQTWLTSNNVQVIYLPDTLSLGESVVAALNLIGNIHEKSLSLLFGDTLLLNYPHETDCFTVSHIEDNYEWSVIDTSVHSPSISENALISDQNNLIINGYFHFSDPALLIKSIIAKRWNFLSALNEYKLHQSFQAKEVNDWLDFGHLHTYFRSKTVFTTQRSFNQLHITDEFVTKSGDDNTKIKAESQWFTQLPGKLRKYIPQLIEVKNLNGKHQYTIEYLHNVPINELFVFSTLPSLTWNKILDACLNFISRCLEYKRTDRGTSDYLNDLLVGKTEQRIDIFCRSANLSRDQRFLFNQQHFFSIDDLITLANQHLPNSRWDENVIHGDFCFSNILYDFRSNSIKTFDPRGILNDGQLSIFGDSRYDLAKLSHAAVGQYDWIMSGYFSVNLTNDTLDFHLMCPTYVEEIKNNFIKKVEQTFAITYAELLAMQIHLFLSMLPLHQDNAQRQQGLFANAFRLGALLKEETQ